jgi:hypothetical protein
MGLRVISWLAQDIADHNENLQFVLDKTKVLRIIVAVQGWQVISQIN